ncbi:uncharacterized protein LOC119583150 [Penaeus monodon]|uniref:uncharacterized protein LOC119583150 n=1 Tax=Penaeus monodon TaxID=6687 RepID=UPI0018A7CBA3|nr:uncharacterized protein LOC119583150 [Penaeus monodon]
MFSLVVICTLVVASYGDPGPMMNFPGLPQKVDFDNLGHVGYEPTIKPLNLSSGFVSVEQISSNPYGYSERVEKEESIKPGAGSVRSVADL